MLHGAYEYLRTTPPFREWSLPEADDVELRITGMQDQGQYDYRGKHIIAISSQRVGHTIRLMTVTAHEMVHLRQQMLGEPLTHGALFKSLSKRVCRYHGFDPKEF